MPSTPYASSGVNRFPGAYMLTVPVFAASAITNADELTDFVPGHAFKVLSVDFVTVTPITTAAKTATVTPYIDGTAVPGVVLTVAGTKAKGVVTSSTAATTPLLGTATSKLKLTASAVTAFVEGAGYFVVHIQNMDAC